MGVLVESASLKRHWHKGAGELHFVLEFDWRELPDREELASLGGEVEADIDSPARVTEWLLSPSGWSAVMRRAHTTEAGVAWLKAFAQRCQGKASGRIIGGPGKKRPPHLWEITSSAFVQYIPDDAPQTYVNHRAWWGVSDEVSARIARRAVAWCQIEGASRHLDRDGWWVATVDDDPAVTLVESMRDHTNAALVEAIRKPVHYRGAGFWPRGQAVYQDYARAQPWETAIASLRRILLEMPTQTDLAFIGWIRTGMYSWSIWPNYWPHVTTTQVAYNGELLGSLTPDAHGVQLLTDAHLARAHDLTGWTITTIAPGRHLVEASDLALWYASEAPDPDVVAAARADFGTMIMTPATIQELGGRP